MENLRHHWRNFCKLFVKGVKGDFNHFTSCLTKTNLLKFHEGTSMDFEVATFGKINQFMKLSGCNGTPMAPKTGIRSLKPVVW